MNKPIEITSFEIKAPENSKITQEELQRMAQEIIARNQQELREYEIYEQGRRDAGRGILGIFGL